MPAMLRSEGVNYKQFQVIYPALLFMML